MVDSSHRHRQHSQWDQRKACHPLSLALEGFVVTHGSEVSGVLDMAVLMSTTQSLRTSTLNGMAKCFALSQLSSPRTDTSKLTFKQLRCSNHPTSCPPRNGQTNKNLIHLKYYLAVKKEENSNTLQTLKALHQVPWVSGREATKLSLT